MVNKVTFLVSGVVIAPIAPLYIRSCIVQSCGW